MRLVGNHFDINILLRLTILITNYNIIILIVPYNMLAIRIDDPNTIIQHIPQGVVLFEIFVLEDKFRLLNHEWKFRYVVF